MMYWWLICIRKCVTVKKIPFWEKELFQFTFNPSWESSDTVQYVSADMILYTLYTGWQTAFMYNFSVYICTQNTFMKSTSRDAQNVKFWRNAKWKYLFFVLPHLEGLVWIEGWVHLPLVCQCFSSSRFRKIEKEREKSRWMGRIK